MAPMPGLVGYLKSVLGAFSFLFVLSDKLVPIFNLLAS